MALVKLLQQYSQPGVIKSPAATVLLVRLAAKLATDEPSMRPTMQTLLDGFLRHKSEMVNFEAARQMINLPDMSDAQGQNVVHVLQLFLTVSGLPLEIWKPVSLTSDSHQGMSPSVGIDLHIVE
jgi:coatomer protein complex subunit gamma